MKNSKKLLGLILSLSLLVTSSGYVFAEDEAAEEILPDAVLAAEAEKTDEDRENLNVSEETEETEETDEAEELEQAEVSEVFEGSEVFEEFEGFEEFEETEECAELLSYEEDMKVLSPLSLLLPFETAKTGVSELTQFDYTQVVSVGKYTGQDSADKLIENNVFTVANYNPDIFASDYPYAEIIYYYKTSGNAPEKPMQMTIGTTYNNDTKEISAFAGKTYDFDGNIVANEWTSQICDLSAMATDCPSLCAEGYVYNHFRLRLFGNTAFGDVPKGDRVYVKAVRFHKNDPRKNNRDVKIKFYKGSTEYGAGSSPLITLDATTGNAVTLPEYSVSAGEIIQWTDANTHKSYRPGESFCPEDVSDINFYGTYLTTKTIRVDADGTGTHTVLQTAIEEAGQNPAVIYVSGNIGFPGAIGNSGTYGGTIRIIGKNGTADKITFSTGNTKIYRSVILENITVKAQPIDERWISTYNAAFTISESCKFEKSDPYGAGNVSTGLYFGHPSAGSGNETVNLNCAGALYTMIGSTALYGQSYIHTGNVTMNFNGGTYNAIYGGARNGQGTLSLYQTLKGDVKYNFNGGSFGKVQLHSLSGGNVVGNIVFTVNGGNASGFALGGSAKGYASRQSYGNTALIFNAKEIEANGGNYSSAALTQQDDYAEVKKLKTILIYNNAEHMDVLPKSVGAANIDYKIKVVGGKALPVFTPSFDGKTGELLGFEITPDEAGGTPYIDGWRLMKNENGLYNLPEGDFSVIEFINEQSTEKYTALFEADEAEGDVAPIEAYGNSKIIIPECEFTKEGFVFGGWYCENDGKTYGAGETFVLTDHTIFRAQFIDPQNVDVLFVDAVNGSDDNFGFSQYSAKKTFESAYSSAATLGVGKIVIIGEVTYSATNLPAHSHTITVTGQYGGRDLGGVLINQNPVNLFGDVVFENLSMGSVAYQFINSQSNSITFGEGLTVAAGTKGVFTHIGCEGKAASKADVTVKSNIFGTSYIGGAYLASETVGLAGDVNITVDVGSGVSFTPVIGFDGFSGHDASGIISGSVVVNAKSGTIPKFTMTRVAAINGAFIMIYTDAAGIPEYDELPDADKGKYSVTVHGDGTFTPCLDENGKVIPGKFDAIPASADGVVKLIDKNGYEHIEKAGTLELSAGNYTVDFVEGASLSTASFTVTAPITGQKPDRKLFAEPGYNARTEWYIGDSTFDYFKASTSHTVKITITPYAICDTSNFSSVRINGNMAKLTKNDDGTFTASYTFPASYSGVIGTREKYVSDTGSDTNSGNQNAPYKSLNTAINALKTTGGTIHIMGKVNIGVTLTANTKPIYITGLGYENAELFLPDSGGTMFSGEVLIENLKITMGTSSHFNDRGNKVTFGDGVYMESGSIFHLGAYGNQVPSVRSADITLGGNSKVGNLSVGGGYLLNADGGILGDARITLDGGTVTSLRVCPDYYLATHTDARLDGNLLVTVNSGKGIGSVGRTTRSLILGNDTVFQFIYNNGTDCHAAVSEEYISRSKVYTVYSGFGGKVEHALDKNGRSISGCFDVIPDAHHIAYIRYAGKTIVSRGGRYYFPAATDIRITYIESEAELEGLYVDLDGGAGKSELFRIDAERRITFLDAPEKNGYIFEGWYADKNHTRLIKNGDTIDGKCELYAKYMHVSRNINDAEFFVKGIQMRIPTKAGDPEQGLRFITGIDDAILSAISDFSDKNQAMLTYSYDSPAGYGTVVLPTQRLAERELVIGGKYISGAKTYGAKTAKAENILRHENGITEYSVCIIRIKPENYDGKYTVRPYITYYTRSGNLVTAYGETYAADVTTTSVAALEAGLESDAVNEYLRNEICSRFAEQHGITFIPQSVLSDIKSKTAALKTSVLSSASMSLSGKTGTKYYISPKGSDSNDGKSSSRPWKTLSKLASASLKSGDCVLFERGGMYRGKISAKNGVTYSAYGSGAKPIINASAQNYASASMWSETGIPNVYKLNATLNNVGIILFNGKFDEIGNDYDLRYGEMRVSGVSYDGEGFYNQYQLKSDLEFYSNLNTNELYLYSKGGNPGTRFDSIEIGAYGNAITIGGNNITIDNLHITLTGSHGIGAGGGLANYDSSGNFKGITGSGAGLCVQNCVLRWLGGSILPGYGDGMTTRYGNAIEIYGSVDGYTVRNNWIYQIYDTAITHQCSGTTVGRTLMRNIHYDGNLVEYCHWSIEFYNSPCEGGYERLTKDVLVENNILSMGGYGWGSPLRYSGAALYNSFGMSNVESETQNFHAKNNIFFRSRGMIYRLNSNKSEKNLTFESNIYVQDYGEFLGLIYGTYRRYDENVADIITGPKDDLCLAETGSPKIYYYLP